MSVPDPCGSGRFHYVGVGGSGMSALAQFQVMRGGRASGSDRSFDKNEARERRDRLERLGITIHPQDGSGVDDDCAAVIVSTAIEDHIPDVRVARERGIPIFHRSEVLARQAEDFRTIAITGTSGKSTVVAMVFEILRAVGRKPSLITGGEVLSLIEQGHWGNAWHGGSDLLVIEADESDGSLIRYTPEIGVVTNLQRDHKEVEEVLDLFTVFRRRTRGAFVVGESDNLASLTEGSIVFGFGHGAEVRATHATFEATRGRFEVEGVGFQLPISGRHNVENALAAIATCHAAGVALEAIVGPLAGFRGVARRFQSLGTARGVEVIDDFAHNPTKIRAALEAAKMRSRRIHAIYQPHGFAPTRFHRSALVDTFTNVLRTDDRVWMLEIYYAGGTAKRDLSSEDIVTDIAAHGTEAGFAPSREWLIDRVAADAKEGDLVLVMGARDPSLAGLAQQLLERMANNSAATRPSGAPK